MRYFTISVETVTAAYAFSVVGLTILDSNPWSVVVALTIAYAFYLFTMTRYQQRKELDVYLSCFLCTQLALAYLSPYDLGKGPHGDSPLSVSADVRVTHPRLRLGLAELLLGSCDSNTVAVWLEWIEYTCLASWVASIVLSLHYPKRQLFQHSWRRAIFAVTCITYLVLHGIIAGINGVSHRFYLAMYCFLALLLELLFDINSHPLVCLFAGYTFVSAGISKLRNSDWTWHTGEALCRHVDFSYTGWQMVFCQVMAPSSLLFELVAPFSMMLDGNEGAGMGTILFVALSILFHLGIAVLMFPRYAPQSFAYILLFRRPQSTEPSKSTASKNRLLQVGSVVVLVATVFLRIETWPLTAVNMYSTSLEHVGFGESLKEATEKARVIHKTKCISDFKGMGPKFIDITTAASSSTVKLPRLCRDNGVWRLPLLGKRKLVKQIVLRGLAECLVCMDELNSDVKDGRSVLYCQSSNMWFNKLAMAIGDLCPEVDSMQFGLILQQGKNIIPVFDWTRQRDGAPLPVFDDKEADGNGHSEL